MNISWLPRVLPLTFREPHMPTPCSPCEELYWTSRDVGTSKIEMGMSGKKGHLTQRQTSMHAFSERHGLLTTIGVARASHVCLRCTSRGPRDVSSDSHEQIPVM